jgi:hypothetical protein
MKRQTQVHNETTYKKKLSSGNRKPGVGDEFAEMFSAGMGRGIQSGRHDFGRLLRLCVILLRMDASHVDIC